MNARVYRSEHYLNAGGAEESLVSSIRRKSVMRREGHEGRGWHEL